MDPKKKAKISAIFADPEEENYKVGLANLARKLAAIWAPAEGSMLHSIIAQPTQVGRALSDRLNPTNQTPLKLVGHPFKDVHSTILKPLATAKTVAYEKDCEIHLVTDVSAPSPTGTRTPWSSEVANRSPSWKRSYYTN